MLLMDKITTNTVSMMNEIKIGKYCSTANILICSDLVIILNLVHG
jgi:hypothetical protein